MNLENLYTFHSLFSQWRYHIPDYQRGYAWGEDQWRDLMDDLSTLTDDNDHFTGLLVLHENKDPNLRLRARGIVKDVYDIVDGQQRLTTILILLNEMQHEMRKLGNVELVEIAESIRETYLFEPGTGDLLVYKLILDQNNHAFFIRNILNTERQDISGPQTKSHQNLLEARNFFQTKLHQKQEVLGENYSAWLEDFYAKISKQMKVMVYQLRSEADAGVVFESMNSRGKKPNQLDLVKNYLLFMASKLETDLRLQRSSEINEAWTEIFKLLNAAGRSDDEDSLLEMHWMTVYNYDRKQWASKKEKSDHIKEYFKPMLIQPELHDDMSQKMCHYVQTLRNTAIAYADIVNPVRSDAFQIFTDQPALRKEVVLYSLKLIRLNNLRPFIPLLVSVRLRFPVDAQKYLEAVKLCEKYAFRVFRVANQRTNSSEGALFRFANLLFAGKMSFDYLMEEIHRELLIRCSNGLFRRSFELENPDPWYGKRGVVYFLYEYEEELFKPEEPIINWQTIHEGGQKSIEHILPQNPPENGYWLAHFSNDERQRLTHQIGNLTLILSSWNSSLGTKAFPDKKGNQGQKDPCYANSDLKITHSLVTVKEWTSTAIAERQKYLADWALKRWHVEAPPALPVKGWERQVENARRNGVETELLALNEVALKLGLEQSPGKNCMIYKPKYNKTLSAITVYPYQDALWVYIRPHNFPRQPGLTEERVKEAFDDSRGWWVPKNQFPEFRSRLGGLLTESAPVESPDVTNPSETINLHA